MDVGPFFLTQPNPTQPINLQAQPNPTHDTDTMNPTENLTQPNPTHGWTQPTSISRTNQQRDKRRVKYNPWQR